MCTSEKKLVNKINKYILLKVGFKVLYEKLNTIFIKTTPMLSRSGYCHGEKTDILLEFCKPTSSRIFIKGL